MQRNPVSGVAVNFVWVPGRSMAGNHPVSDASGVATVEAGRWGQTAPPLVGDLNDNRTFTADMVWIRGSDNSRYRLTTNGQRRQAIAGW
jgi:hypothetical protein